MIEIWKDISGYEGLYAVSSFGNIKSYPKQNGVAFRKERMLIPGLAKGYHHVVLCKDGIQIKVSVHRLVALLFISNPENKPQVNHINSIRNDNRVENLEWCTASENTIHAVKFGNLIPPIISGASLNRGHLTESDIALIRDKRESGAKTIDLAIEFNVTQRNIQHIVSTKPNNKKGWRQVA